MWSRVQEYMSIPAGWLCYLAPEVIRELRVHQTSGEDLPFTRYKQATYWFSKVYAPSVTD